MTAGRNGGTRRYTARAASPTDADRDAARTTHRVLPAGPLKLLAAHIPALARHPRRYLSTLGYALRLDPEVPAAGSGSSSTSPSR